MFQTDFRLQLSKGRTVVRRPRKSDFSPRLCTCVYQEIESLGDQLLSTVFIVTSKADQAYATSCKDYMEWQWPRSRLATL